MNLLTINNMTKAYTDKILFNNVDFSINEGDKIGIIGINGTGKSTLLKILAQIDEMDKGSYTKGNNVHIRYLSQNPYFEKDISIYDYVITQNTTKENQWQIEGDAKNILNRLGFTDYNIKIHTLSGGQKKRVALAATLLDSSEILILDEPTNHLDNTMSVWLENYLKNMKSALVMVTHDRYFLDRVSNRIVEIDKGNLYTYIGNYSTFLSLKMEREEMSLATERKRQSILRTELEWISRGARARSTKQKAQIERYEDLKGQSGPNVKEKVEMNSLSSRLGKTTIELDNISKAYGNKLLISDFTYYFLKNDRIGIIGPNGCGKTTLMKIINRVIEPDSGNITIGSTVKIGYFSQENEYMDESMRVIDYIKNVGEFVKTTDGTISASQMLEKFLFDSTLQYSLIEKLSGGEKRRLYLLMVLISSPNILILDEPTNDLDIETLTILEDYLDTFDGIVVTVSHDRYFLDRIVNRIFAFEGEGLITQYEGGFTDYLGKAPIENKAFSSEAVEKVKTEKPKTTKLKFTYQEQKDWEQIEGTISTLEEAIENLDKEITKCATDFVKLNQLIEEKASKEALLEEKMDRWMYLTELKETIDAQNK